MAQQWEDVVGTVRSWIAVNSTFSAASEWIAANWNAKAMMISAAVATSGLAVIGFHYLLKSDIAHRFEAAAIGQIMAEYNRRMVARKRQLFGDLESLKHARGDGRLAILEIGSGNGTNFAYYPVGSDVICVEPNEHFKATLYDNARQYPGVQISAYHVAPAEKTRDHVESASVDAVVSSVVFCTVSDPDQCIQEIIRVLKPGGKFFFMEHVKAPPQFYVVRCLQILVNPVWGIIYGGCHLTRRTLETIRKAGFRCVNAEEFEAHELTQPPGVIYGGRLIRSHLSGTATK